MNSITEIFGVDVIQHNNEHKSFTYRTHLAHLFVSRNVHIILDIDVIRNLVVWSNVHSSFN